MPHPHDLEADTRLLSWWSRVCRLVEPYAAPPPMSSFFAKAFYRGVSARSVFCAIVPAPRQPRYDLGGEG